MTKQQLLQKLFTLKYEGDSEQRHHKADSLLVSYINDPDIAAAYEQLPKGYQ